MWACRPHGALDLVWMSLWLLIASGSANTEKTIFLAPEPQDFPSDASLDNLLLEHLTLVKPTVRTHLNASFPADDRPKGTQTWMILEDLTPGQRYEVRICWLATQPTSFWIYTHTMLSAFEDPDLVSSLTLYSSSRRDSITPFELQDAGLRTDLRKRAAPKRPTTFLFLQIFAAADYFSLNKTLMENVLPVHVDVILDPYLLNIFPQSLLPTVPYLIVIAIFGWFASGWLYTNLIMPMSTSGAVPTSKKSE